MRRSIRGYQSHGWGNQHRFHVADAVLDFGGSCVFASFQQRGSQCVCDISETSSFLIASDLQAGTVSTLPHRGPKVAQPSHPTVLEARKAA